MGKGEFMSEVNRLTNALFSDTNKELLNLKFFLGDNRNITVDDIARECALAFEQEEKGMLKHNNSLDASLESKKITAQ